MNALSRRSLAGVVTVGALLASAGCSMFSATQVLKPAQLADGVSAQVGQVEAHDLVVVGDKDRPGVLIGALTNGGTQPETVTISVEGSNGPTQVQVPAGSIVKLDPATQGASVVIPKVQAAAGAMTQLQLSTPSGGTVQVQAPVLPTSLPYYATVTPPASPTPSGTATSGTTSSPTATDTQQPTTSPS